jgi:hypothetical protein
VLGHVPLELFGGDRRGDHPPVLQRGRRRLRARIYIHDLHAPAAEPALRLEQRAVRARGVGVVHHLYPRAVGVRVRVLLGLPPRLVMVLLRERAPRDAARLVDGDALDGLGEVVALPADLVRHVELQELFMVCALYHVYEKPISHGS